MMNKDSGEITREMLPIEETFGADTLGIANDLSTDWKEKELGDSSLRNGFQIDGEKVNLRDIYLPKDLLEGDDAKKSRFVFSNRESDKVGSGGVAGIYRAIDRLTGRKIVAKIIKIDSISEFGPEYIEQVKIQTQVEAELMSILEEDPYLRDHVVKVFDVSNSLISGKEVIIIFEEDAKEEGKVDLNAVDYIGNLSFDQRLEVIKQLCNIIDTLAKYNIFHHNLTPANIFLDLKKIIVKVGDFGSANFGFDPKNMLFASSPGWVSPERELHEGSEDDSGLISEVFSLTVLIYFILTNGKYPYYENYWPSERDVFKDESDEFLTGFHPKSKDRLKNRLKDTFEDDEINKLIKVIEKGLAIDPKDRYKSGEELFNSLSNALDSRSTKIMSFIREALTSKL